MSKTYTINESINALLDELRSMGLDYLEESVYYEYDIEFGQRVHILFEEVPDFPINEEDVMMLTEYRWRVEVIRSAEIDEGEEINLYEVIFFSEDVI